MQISKIILHNWKNFKECTVDISNRCFIVGANATGKSNFLDAFRFLYDIVKQGGGLQTAVALRGGVTKIRSLSARIHTNISIEVEIRENDAESPKWRYLLDIKNQGKGIQTFYASVIREQVYSYEQHKFLLDRHYTSELEDEETLRFTHLEQPTSNASFREVRDAFLTIEYLNVVPQLVRESNSYVLTAGKEDYYGRNFLKRLSSLNEKTRKSYLRRINEVMVKVVPHLTELSFMKDGQGVPHLEARFQHWRAKGAKQNEVLFSDGTLRMIGFLFAMLDGSGIILLEEPEINLHSSVVEQLPEYIASMQRQKGRQVIATTHSFDILNNNGIRPSEVLYLESTEEGTAVKNAFSDQNILNIVNSGFSMADALIPMLAPKGVNEIPSLKG